MVDDLRWNAGIYLEQCVEYGPDIHDFLVFWHQKLVDVYLYEKWMCEVMAY